LKAKEREKTEWKERERELVLEVESKKLLILGLSSFIRSSRVLVLKGRKCRN